MERYFNTAGTCVPGAHYMIPPERRLAEARTLVERGLYFVLHAPRQSGKTTLLYSLARTLNAEGRFAAIVISMEHLRRETDVQEANWVIVRNIFRSSQQFLSELEAAPDPAAFWEDSVGAVHAFLGAWAGACPRPIVLFIDEADSLPEAPLLNLLGQLRMGYTARPAPFAHSVALVGLRDLRDYRVQLRPESESLGTSSPFNVKSESLTLKNFTAEEVTELYLQHTEETGQKFEPDALRLAFDLTGGQPWLVNALARQIVEKDVRDREQTITRAHVDAARETLIERRDTHLDSLIDKLHEERVRRIVEPILAGEMVNPDVMNDDFTYARDLGLIVAEPMIRIANPIYQEVIPRALTYIMQRTIPQDETWYEAPDGSLDVPALLRGFQAFFAENSEGWLGRFDYKEAGPHLILMAFLQRILNGGGQIQREYAVGAGRVDLLATWRGQKFAIELKVRRSDKTIDQGVQQLCRYLDRVGLSSGYLVLFDRRPDIPWEQKTYEKEATGPAGQKITVFGA